MNFGTIKLTEPTNFIQFINYMYERDKLHCHPKTNSNAKNVGWYLALKKSFSGMLTRNMLGQHNPDLLSVEK
jgi:hypothetical protein